MKRRHSDADAQGRDGDNLPKMTLEPFRLTSTQHALPSKDDNEDSNGQADWKIVSHCRPKKPKKVPKKESSNYPSITYSTNSRLQTHVRIGDLQALVLYILADGPSPQWISVRHHKSIWKVVVVMVPGLEAGMFNGDIPLKGTSEDIKAVEALPELKKAGISREVRGLTQIGSRSSESPDSRYPVKLLPDRLPEPLSKLADIFPYVWPVMTPGDEKYGKLYSPLQAMLIAPLPKSAEEKKFKGIKSARESLGWQSKRTRITEFIASIESLQENEYTIHPALSKAAGNIEEEQRRRLEAKETEHYGWVNTLIDSIEDGNVPEESIEQGSLTAGRQLIAMDCEMCKTSDDEFSLTRVTLVGWDGEVILDELVKPEKPVTDYLTPYEQDFR